MITCLAQQVPTAPPMDTLTELRQLAGVRGGCCSWAGAVADPWLTAGDRRGARMLP